MIKPPLLRKTAAKSVPRKSKSRQREEDRGQQHINEDDSASEPADSIIDSGSEREEDSEVDDMLGD